jgi:hypothetical protein
MANLPGKVKGIMGSVAEIIRAWIITVAEENEP